MNAIVYLDMVSGWVDTTSMNCSKDGCVNLAKRRGLCLTHYHYEWRHSPKRPKCLIDGCEKPVYAKRLCSSHYQRQRQYGNPEAGDVAKGVPLKFLRSLINNQPWPSECVLWPFGQNGNGYGSLYFEGRVLAASRVSLIISSGKPGDGLEAAHNCGNRRCVNPLHLRWDTRAGNDSDKDLHCTRVRGERMWCAKLCEADVIAIRKRHAKGEDLRAIAQDYEIKRPTAANIVAGRLWKHVPMP